MNDVDRNAMLGMFTHEMGILVDQLENTIISIGEKYTIATINEIFRVMHTIKGSASMMLFTTLADVTHVIEDLFFFLRERPEMEVDYNYITDLVLEVVDFVKEELVKIEEEDELSEKPELLITNITAYLRELKGENKEEKQEKQEKNPENAENTVKEVIEDKSFSAKIFFKDGSEMENVRAFTMVHNLKDIANNIVTTPENVLNEDSVNYIRKNGFQISFTSSLSIEKIKDTLDRSIYIREIELSEVESEKEEAPTFDNTFYIQFTFQEGAEMENVRAYTFLYNLGDKIHVISQEPENLLDEGRAELIRQSGFSAEISTNMTYKEIEEALEGTAHLKDFSLEKHERVILESEADAVEEVDEIKALDSIEIVNLKPESSSISSSTKGEVKKKSSSNHSISVNLGKLDQLLNLVGELVISEAMVTQNPELQGLELDNFTKESRQLRKIIKEIQDSVTSMRMVPLSPTFFKMQRIVRDMCRQLKKDVNLEVLGEDTEVDKNIIEHIADPLMHIIRNSIDHGIELPEVRLENGKDEKGTVILEAKNSGGDVLIIIKDDGAGFNRDKILSKASRLGLLSKPAEEYTDKEIYQFVFYPGFSTNEEVTSYSGRGVGMDVVNTNLEHIGGTVIADSVEGEGSTITLKIPLTLAIIDGMLISIGESKYIIPIMEITRSLKVKKSDIVIDPNQNEMIKVRGEVFNLIRLKDYFGLDYGIDNIEEGIVLMLENADQTICVFADELIGEQQIVVKNIPKYIKKVNGLSGCTLLGNGDISLIINVPSFFDR